MSSSIAVELNSLPLIAKEAELGHLGTVRFNYSCIGSPVQKDIISVFYSTEF